VKRAKVLLVNNDPITGEFIRSRLETKDFVVTIVTEYGKTVEIARQMIPDLILLDASASNPECYGACRDIRKVSDIPIVILSAREEELDKVLFFNLGADDHVTKPYSLEVLIARLKAVLRRTRNNTGMNSLEKAVVERQTQYAVVGKVSETI
jgi:DNA-binding response OmpR family regulator